MPILRINHYHIPDPVSERRLDRIEAALEHIIGALNQMALDFTALKNAVADEETVIQSVVALLTSLAQEIRDHAADQAAIADLATRITAQKDALAQAVAANTPASGETPPAA
jgi:septal ring factor EnvC (AmiA/AmiB activator)